MQKIKLIKETFLPYSCCVISVILCESLFNFETSHIFCTWLLYYCSTKTFQAKIWPGCHLHSKHANRRFHLQRARCRWVLSPSYWWKPEGVGVRLIIVHDFTGNLLHNWKGNLDFLSHCPVPYWQNMLFLHIILQWCLSVSLEISSFALSLCYSTGPDWLFKVCVSRLGSRRRMLSLKVRCISWAMREHMWMSLHWLLLLVSLLWTRSKHLPSVSLLVFPPNLSESVHPSFIFSFQRRTS